MAREGYLPSCTTPILIKGGGRTGRRAPSLALALTARGRRPPFKTKRGKSADRRNARSAARGCPLTRARDRHPKGRDPSSRSRDPRGSGTSSESRRRRARSATADAPRRPKPRRSDLMLSGIRGAHRATALAARPQWPAIRTVSRFPDLSFPARDAAVMRAGPAVMLGRAYAPVTADRRPAEVFRAARRRVNDVAGDVDVVPVAAGVRRGSRCGRQQQNESDRGARFHRSPPGDGPVRRLDRGRPDRKSRD